MSALAVALHVLSVCAYSLLVFNTSKPADRMRNGLLMCWAIAFIVGVYTISAEVEKVAPDFGSLFAVITAVSEIVILVALYRHIRVSAQRANEASSDQ